VLFGNSDYKATSVEIAISSLTELGNRCDTFWILKHKIATATFVQDKTYKGFSKFIME
jgi:hypothetical protein